MEAENYRVCCLYYTGPEERRVEKEPRVQLRLCADQKGNCANYLRVISNTGGCVRVTGVMHSRRRSVVIDQTDDAEGLLFS
jgi:hypothetical protein